MSGSQRPPFPNPPLALTVLEIRYPDLSEQIGSRSQQQMRDVLQEWFPLVENTTEQQFELQIGALAPTSVQTRTVPRFVTRDRTTALVVKESALVLETTTYEGWEGSFRPMISEVVRVFEEVSQPDGVLRIGLRYIDEIRVPKIDDVPGDWRGYIDDHLLAAANPDFIPPSLQPAVWQGLVQYKTTNDSTLTVRYGPQSGHAVNPNGTTRRRKPPEAGPYFLLDSDSFWQAEDEVPEFKANSIMKLCDTLHSPIREFFQIAVTEKLRNEVFEMEGGTQK